MVLPCIEDTHSELSKWFHSWFPIKKVAIIGIHGWFPAIRFVPPKSLKFAEMMATATAAYFNDYYGTLASISVIPLEGEGRVMDRLDLLYEKLIDPSQSWLSSVVDADLVVFSAHSQGSPVASLLMERLIQRGLINPQKQKTGILAMAGISHGPYPYLKSNLFVKYVDVSTPLKELFEFNNPEAQVSQQYYSSLKTILNAGTKFVAIGSWYDQVVPLYSATLQGFNHPNIFRALYIDSADYRPDFLSHLVVFGLKLRNFGLDDYGLVVHLSDILQGNIYGFGTQGHYALYEELNTYKLGISWIMGNSVLYQNTSNANEIASKSIYAPIKNNPYNLPWIMSKIHSDPKILEHPNLSKELIELQNLYENWEAGNNKLLKEIKYSLESMKSKL
jgi:hypothetical protein